MDEAHPATVADWLVDGPEAADCWLCLAHGAGAPMESDFMAAMAGRLAARGARVIRFEFPYMRKRRADGKKRPPDRQPVLLDTYRAVVAAIRAGAAGPPPARLAIGGKSMGGRMASLIADETRVDALICLGYPFHPPGKPEKLRTEHLESLDTPALICQGERDPFGRREEVADYALSPRIAVHWVPDGDHDLKPRKKSGIDPVGSLDQVADATIRALRAPA